MPIPRMRRQKIERAITLTVPPVAASVRPTVATIIIINSIPYILLLVIIFLCGYLLSSEKINHHSEAELTKDCPYGTRHLDIDIDVRRQNGGVGVVDITEQNVDKVDCKKVIRISKTICVRQNPSKEALTSRPPQSIWY